MSEGSIGVRRGGQIRAKNAYDDLFAPFKERPYPPIISGPKVAAVESPTAHDELQRIKSAGLYVIPEHRENPNIESSLTESPYLIEGHDRHEGIKQKGPWASDTPWENLREIPTSAPGELIMNTKSVGKWAASQIVKQLMENPQIEGYYQLNETPISMGIPWNNYVFWP